YDYARAIFAADGCNSAVRRQLERTGWCHVSHIPGADAYKQFRLSSHGSAQAGLRRDVLHGWPRRFLLAGAFPEPDGSFAGTLHLPASGSVSFAAMSDRAHAMAVLDTHCRDLTRIVPDLVDQLAVQRSNSVSTVMCR